MSYCNRQPGKTNAIGMRIFLAREAPSHVFCGLKLKKKGEKKLTEQKLQ